MNISIDVKLILISLLFFLFFPSAISAAEIKLVMPSNIGKNQVFPVQVYLDTQGELTVGTDLLFGFDSTDLVFVQVDEANFYSNYHEPIVFLDKGQIRYSGTSNYNDYQAGNELFATFFFKKKKIGKPELHLIWLKDKTNDTNVISENGTDLLTTSPIIEYDNSLRIKPSSKNEKPGKVLGRADTLTDLFEESISGGSVLGKATVIEKENSRIKYLVFLTIVFAFGLALLFLWKKKKKND